MGLRFPGNWRFRPPQDGQYANAAMPREAVSEFINAVERISGQGNRWSLLEHYKSHFGNPHRSSSESWAEGDLHHAMHQSADNAPIFIEAFFNACEELTATREDWYAPDAEFINQVLVKHKIGYQIRENELFLRDLTGATIPVEVSAPSLEETARQTIRDSLNRSDELLAQGRSREAVQEVLWLLETISTGFRGVETESGKVEGKYFNHIVRELRSHHRGTTMDRILEWATQMHGYLSSPKGGGVRHGTDLKDGISLSLSESRLFCNLTRSYITFLLHEHESMS